MVRRVRAVLAGVVLVLLALAVGAMPASAGRLAGGGPPTSAFSLGLLQPGPPTGLTATAASSSEVDLSWTAPSDGSAAGYNVYEGTSSGGEGNNPVNSNPITGTSYPVTGLSGGTAYYFVVTAVDRAGNESDPSDEASATPGQPGPGQLGPGQPGPGPPAGPSGSSPQQWLVLVVVVVVGSAIAGALVAVRRRRRSRLASVPGTPVAPGPGAHAPPGSSIRAVPHPGPPRSVSINTTGTDAAHTVRFAPHPDASVVTIEEAPPP